MAPRNYRVRLVNLACHIRDLTSRGTATVLCSGQILLAALSGPCTDSSCFEQNLRTVPRKSTWVLRTKAGNVVSSYSDFQQPNYNLFCIIDWSPDGNYLLLQEILGHLYSDVWDEFYWIYERVGRGRTLLDLKPLKQAIEQKWRKTGVDFREVSYQTLAIGWEGRNSQRVVFDAFTYNNEPAIFLGRWSVLPSGKEPKLLSEKEGGFKVAGFGEIVDAPD